MLLLGLVLLLRPVLIRASRVLPSTPPLFQSVDRQSFMPRPWEMKGALDLVTADFTYVRWLGNRNAIEKQTTTRDKIVIDKQADLRSWVVVLRRLVEDKHIRKIFAFANNHYAGHAPATVKQFWELWNRK